MATPNSPTRNVATLARSRTHTTHITHHIKAPPRTPHSAPPPCVWGVQPRAAPAALYVQTKASGSPLDDSRRAQL